jgi:sterol desaturase/sphingolipid hydroxylase (fatty acid hydroxylase superfamily)
MSSGLFGSLGILMAVMVGLAVLETLVPFRSSSWRGKGRLAANLGLTATTLALNFALGVLSALGSNWLRDHRLGLFSGTPAGTLWLLVVGVVALDGSSYVAHRLMHALPGWWRVHRVHHADPFVDVSTALRQHPLETVIRFTFMTAPAWLLGLPVAVVAVYRALSATNALLEHANVKVWPALDRVLTVAVVTPNMHKVHHSRERAETDSNYGNVLAVFDRLGGTFTSSARCAQIEYGLDGYDDREAQRFTRLIRLPLEGR